MHPRPVTLVAAGRAPGLGLGLLALALGLTACLPGDLKFSGKRCDADSPCPIGWTCVLEPDSATTRLGHCYGPSDAPTCQSGQRTCAPDAGWVEICEADGHSRAVDQICEPERACNPDTTQCALACAADGDCTPGDACDLGTGLCLSPRACEPATCEGTCLDTLCVPGAPADASSSTGVADLNCFGQAPAAPPDTPALCELTGRVNLFPALNNSDLAIGLQIRLLDAATPHDLIQQVPVTEGADGAGYYALPDVQTNRRYVVAVQAGTAVSGQEVVTTFNTGVELRADRCPGGVFTLGISALPRSTYETFTSGTLDGLDPHRGLIIGRALDCSAAARRTLGNITVGLTFPPPTPGRIYYFADGDYLIPDLDLTATSNKGYYAVAGAPAASNAIAFGAKLGPTDLILGRADFFLQPDSATIVDLPLPQERLP